MRWGKRVWGGGKFLVWVLAFSAVFGLYIHSLEWVKADVTLYRMIRDYLIFNIIQDIRLGGMIYVERDNDLYSAKE